MDASKSNKTPCPNCGKPLRLGGVAAGDIVHCPQCAAPISLGGAAASGPQRQARRSDTPRAGKDNASTGRSGPKRPPRPSVEQPLTIDETGSPKVVPVHPFIERAAGELPIAKPISPEDAWSDDAYEPEIPLIPSNIPDQSFADAKLERFGEHRRELTAGIDDDLEADLHRSADTDISKLYLESARRRGMLRHYITPDPPRWTYLSGVFDFPWRGVNLSRWTIMSLGLSVAIGLSYIALETLGLLGGDLSARTPAGVFLATMAVFFDVLVLALIAACSQAAIQDTSEGHLLPQEDSMPELGQWIFIALSWLMLGTAAATAGIPLSLAIGSIAYPIMVWFLFPFLLLSTLETESIVMPFSWPVIRSLATMCGGWLSFYLLSTCLASALGIAAFYGAVHAPLLTFVVAAPALAAFLLIYARLLGRLAWKASGSPMAQVEVEGPDGEDADALEVADDRPRYKKRSQQRIVIPDPDE